METEQVRSRQERQLEGEALGSCFLMIAGAGDLLRPACLLVALQAFRKLNLNTTYTQSIPFIATALFPGHMLPEETKNLNKMNMGMPQQDILVFKWP